MAEPQPEAARADSARRQATRQRLLDAAFETFAENGFHGTSIEMVTFRADFTRGAFYSNFASKEELFFAMVEEVHERMLDQLESAVASVDWPATAPGGRIDPDSLTLLLGSLLAGLPKDETWFRLDAEFETLGLRDPEIASHYLQLQYRWRERIAGVITLAIGAVGAQLRVSAAEAAQVLTAYYVTGMREAILSGSAADFVAGRGPHVRTMALVVSALLAPAES